MYNLYFYNISFICCLKKTQPYSSYTTGQYKKPTALSSTTTGSLVVFLKIAVLSPPSYMTLN